MTSTDNITVLCLDRISVEVPRDEAEVYFTYFKGSNSTCIVPLTSRLFSDIFATCRNVLTHEQLPCTSSSGELAYSGRILGRQIDFDPMSWARDGRIDVFRVLSRFCGYCWYQCVAAAYRSGHTECANYILSLPKEPDTDHVTAAIYARDLVKFTRLAFAVTDRAAAIRQIYECDWAIGLLATLDFGWPVEISAITKYAPVECLKILIRLFPNRITSTMLLQCVESIGEYDVHGAAKIAQLIAIRGTITPLRTPKFT